MYHDHHFHPFGYALLVNGLDLFDSPDLTTALERVAKFAESREGPVIVERLNDESLADRRLPTRDDIDDVIGDRPVLIYRYCGHVAMANSAALTMAGINSETPDPDGGSIDRDRSGRPTGVLRETAVALVDEVFAPLEPQPSDDQILDAWQGLTDIGLGSVTGIVAASHPQWCGIGDELETVCRLAETMPIDMLLYVTADNPGVLTDAAARIERAGGRIRFGGWKDWSDGSFGGHTAAMHEPYSDNPSERGLVRLDPAHAIEMGETSLRLGGGVALHAIGDRANDLVLDIHEDLIGRGADSSRLRIEHASILTAPAVERAGRLGVTASVQPAFLASEEDWLVKRLGEERMNLAYPFRSLSEAGAAVIGGSDAPVEGPDPVVGIRAAVDRFGINPSESVDRETAESWFRPPAFL